MCHGNNWREEGVEGCSSIPGIAAGKEPHHKSCGVGGGHAQTLGSRRELTWTRFLPPGRPSSSCSHHATPEVCTGPLGADQALWGVPEPPQGRPVSP